MCVCDRAPVRHPLEVTAKLREYLMTIGSVRYADIIGLTDADVEGSLVISLGIVGVGHELVRV